MYNESAVITNAVFVDEYLCFQEVPAFFSKVSQVCYQSCCLSGNALYSVSPMYVNTGDIKTN